MFCYLFNKKLVLQNGGFSWNRTNDTKIFSLVLCQLSYEAIMAVRTGLEPVISRVTGERDNHYTNEPWLREPDLNQQPLGYEPSELPDCSIPRRSKIDGGGKGIRTPAPISRPPGFQDRSLQPDLGIPP